MRCWCENGVFVFLRPCRTGFMILPCVLIARAEVMWALGCLVKTVLLHNWAWSHNLAQGLPSHSHLMHAGYSHVKRRVGNGTRRLLSVCLLCRCDMQTLKGVVLLDCWFVFCLWCVLFIWAKSLSQCFFKNCWSVSLDEMLPVFYPMFKLHFYSMFNI